MRRVFATTFAVAAAFSLVSVSAQMQMQETLRKVEGAGIHAAGWKGKSDPQEKTAKIEDSKFDLKGGEFDISTAPGAVYWNPANTASGDYTVSATFTEPAYMSSNDHPHPYGVFIGGNKLDTDAPTLLYCAAYGNGNFILRAFPTSFAPGGGRRPASNAAVKKAEGKGQPVAQEIALAVKGDKVTCSINGAEVASVPKADLVGAGKLESLDGIAGIRVGHNVDVKVTNFKVAK
jgi:hypothetical protein